MLLFSLFPTLLPLAPPRSPSSSSAPSAAFSLRAEAPESRELTCAGAGRAKWLPRVAAPAGPVARAPRLGQGGPAAGARRALVRGGRTACRPCARVRGRRRGAPRADGGSAGCCKVVTGRRARGVGISGGGAGPEAPLLPRAPATAPRAAEASPASEVHVLWGAGGAAGTTGQQRAPTCCWGAICGWRRAGQRVCLWSCYLVRDRKAPQT